MGFSQASRWRLLKLIATIDWEAPEKSLFLTLTYPPDVGTPTHRQLSMHRARFWRYAEKHLGRHLPAIWRTEWKPRQSGEDVGLWKPHHHLIALGISWYDKEDVNEHWRKTLMREGYVRTEVKACTGADGAAEYVAKYQAKEAADGSLVNAAYHNRSGRPWGVLRKELIPRCKKYRAAFNAGEKLDQLYRLAFSLRPDWACRDQTTFSMVGPHAEKIVSNFLKGELTEAVDVE